MGLSYRRLDGLLEMVTAVSIWMYAHNTGLLLSLLLSPALLEGPALISQCLVVMRGYQCLSPSLFAQADFNPAKLLPSLSDLQVAKQKPASCGHTTHPAVMMATLALLEEAPGDYFKWRLRVC